MPFADAKAPPASLGAFAAAVGTPKRGSAMALILIVIGVVAVIVIFGMMKGDPSVDQIPDGALNMHLKAASDWIARYHTLSSPPQDLQEKYQYKEQRVQELLREIEKRRLKSFAAAVEGPYEQMIGEIMAYKEYVAKIVVSTGRSEDEINSFAEKKMNEYKAAFMAEGYGEQKASEAALTKLIAESPSPSKSNNSPEPIEAPQSATEKPPKAIRSPKDVIVEFNLTDEEFVRLFASYKFSLGASGNAGNWNADIDDFSRSIGALTEEEIELARTDFSQAVLNRIVVRNMAGRNLKT